MPDIKLIEIDEGGTPAYDIGIENGDLVPDDGLETAILTSILSDQRADESQVPQPEFRRGWIGDLVTPFPGVKYGSLIWLTEQSRLTQSVLNSIKDYAQKSLQWMIDTGLANEIEATATRRGSNTVLLTIRVVSPGGGITEKAFTLWSNTINVT